MRVVSGASGFEDGGVSWARMKMPWVASLACWRKTVDVWVGVLLVSVVVVAGSACFELGSAGRSGSWSTSMGMFSLWQAKIEFMMGMYWWARSVEGDNVIIKIRDCRTLVELLFGSVAVAAD